MKEYSWLAVAKFLTNARRHAVHTAYFNSYHRAVCVLRAVLGVIGICSLLAKSALQVRRITLLRRAWKTVHVRPIKNCSLSSRTPLSC